MRGDKLLIVKDIIGNEEMLTDFKSLTRTRRLNGDKTISLTTFPTARNKHAFDLVGEESTITLGNENYIIKKQKKKGIGNTYFKQSEAINDFFVKLINSQQPTIHNGSMTFVAACRFVLGDLFTFNIIDSFNAQSFENFGNENRLALFQKMIDRYQVEFTVSNNVVSFRKQIGNGTDFQFRYGHNIKSIEENIDTSNLATVIRGTGAEGITATYRSPNADLFGEIEASPVSDERFTTQESLLAEMQSRLIDTPEVSITIDFVDLRAAGYPYTIPNEGDRVFLIYEPMGNLLLETRIVEIQEEFDINLNPIRTKVTLSSYKKTFSKSMFDMVQKALRQITNEDGILKYDVMDEAVKLATEALKSAQTELTFENGIIARDKENPNSLVLLNSNGIGISTDSGQTFRQAITANGVVTDVLTAGQIKTNNVQIVGQDNLFYWDGTALQAYNPSDLTKFVKLNSDGLYISKGSITLERPDGVKIINNGLASWDFAVYPHEPPYKAADIKMYEVGEGVVNTYYAYNTATFEYLDVNFYSYRHTGRFLKMDINVGATASGQVQFAVFDRDGVTKLTEVVTGIGLSEFNTVRRVNIDLGTPTLDLRSFYIRLAAGVPNIKVFLKINRIWQEG